MTLISDLPDTEFSLGRCSCASFKPKPSAAADLLASAGVLSPHIHPSPSAALGVFFSPRRHCVHTLIVKKNIKCSAGARFFEEPEHALRLHKRDGLQYALNSECL